MVCKQLGYQQASRAFSGAAHGHVTDPVRYGWMMWHALKVSQISMIADTVGGENMIVLTAETQV